ncbi:MAG: hypothetical protein KDC81_11315 [Flavobacteriaceae bacterium]|jgi:hypothetical protein|uniref:hypothetical protein n=1 Tax=Winogradskyella sp. HB-48 TaxID=3416808 RepID=UPI001DAC21A4|nr:hypothetical protein [Flavobacteriaceae bacterium]|tara:strand:- start:1649 stop:1816 length:168 start_codon:yes stop_codon:yes gene_type:complete
MGRKSFQEIQQKQLLDNNDLEEHLSKEFIDLNEAQKNELALSIYQFTKLIFDSAK